MDVRVEQHLVRLQRIGAQEERPAVAQLELRHLELGALAGHHRPVLAPVELERLARRKGQRHKGAAPSGPRQLLLRLSPRPGKRRHPVIRALETQRQPDPRADAAGCGVACVLCVLPPSATRSASSRTRRSCSGSCASDTSARPPPLARYFRIVLRDSLVRRAISRIDTPSRRCQRLMTLNIATLITPSPARLPSRTVSIRGSNLNANHP